MKKVLVTWLTVCVAIFMISGIAFSAQQADGVGNILIFPYYQASDKADTYFKIVNTNTTSPVSVHISFRTQGNSQDAKDFCINLSPADAMSMKAYKDGDSYKVSIVDGSDCPAHDGVTDVCNDSGPGEVQTGDVLTLQKDADSSSCGFTPEIGYVTAYEVANCTAGRDNIQNTLKSIFGEEEVVEKSRSSVYALNAVAVEAANASAAITALQKSTLYGTYKYGHTAFVLTTPTIQGTTSRNNGITARAWVNGSPVTNSQPQCGMYQVNATTTLIYDMNEQPISTVSPWQYPINEVSIVNFADADTNSGSQYGMGQFFTTGSYSNGGLEIVGTAPADGDEGWFAWDLTKAPSGMNATIGSYFILTNSNLAWLPCQYKE